VKRLTQATEGTLHSAWLASANFDRRTGVTLTEVLMSLMIMSIGISSVMVLFPISVLRSVQSTQLTNAAILKYNAEAQIRQNPRLIFDPDADGDFFEHVRSPQERNYVVDPFGFYGLIGGDNDGDGQVNNTDASFAGRFGNLGGSSLWSLRRFEGGVSTIPLFPNFAANEYLAAQLARLGDGRTVILDSTAAPNGEIQLNATGQIVGVTLDDTVDPGDLDAAVTAADLWEPLRTRIDGTLAPVPAIPIPTVTEITVFSMDGRFSQTFPLVRCDGRDCYWSEISTEDYNQNGFLDVRSLPLEFLGKVGRVAIKTVKPADFSWLLTVRRSGDGGARGVDVVVRYHTGVTPEDERVFPASFQAGFGFVGVNDAVDGTPPVLKRGSYVFDAKNARWYRITDYQIRNNETISSGNAFDKEFWKMYQYRVTIESETVASVGKFPKWDSEKQVWEPAVIDYGAMFIPGVVDVYPIGSLGLPADLAQEAR
jgi:type II secretory pathway pseudopilin PulG